MDLEEERKKRGVRDEGRFSLVITAWHGMARHGMAHGKGTAYGMAWHMAYGMAWYPKNFDFLSFSFCVFFASSDLFFFPPTVLGNKFLF